MAKIAKLLFKYKLTIVIITVIMLVAYLLFYNKVLDNTQLEVVSVIPVDSVNEVSVNSTIIVRFNKNIEQVEAENLQFSISPDVPFILTTEDNSMVVKFEHSLTGGTKYVVSVLFNDNQLYESGFTTIGVKIDDIKEIARQQSIDDLEFGESFKKILADYPWYGKLPIETNRYTIVYDNVKELFRIRLKITPISPEQESEILKDALQALVSIGAPNPPRYTLLKP